MDNVNEKSTAYLTVTFYDKDDNPDDPASASYEIHDGESDTEIRADTALVTAAGVVEITLSKTDNTMVDSTKPKEIRKVTVHAVYGGLDELHSEFRYAIVGLEHVTNPA